MADIASFPTIHDVLWAGDNTQNFKASGAITAGMVVYLSGDMTVTKTTSLAHPPVGVAISDAATGYPVAVALTGCIVYVANTDNKLTAGEGDYVIVDDNAVGGTVSKIAKGALPRTLYSVLGVFVEDMAANSVVRILIQPHIIVGTVAS
jgi:hypothetical protein